MHHFGYISLSNLTMTFLNIFLPFQTYLGCNTNKYELIKPFFLACIETSRGRVLWLFQGLFSLIYIVNCSDNVLTLCTGNYIAIKATRLLVLIMYRNCRNDYFIEFSSCTAFTFIFNLMAAAGPGPRSALDRSFGIVI